MSKTGDAPDSPPSQPLRRRHADRDMDRAEQWAAEPYSADDRRPSRAETDADQWHHAWDDDDHTWADMVRGVAVDSTGWGYLPGHAPIYVGLDGA
jgi:hypothetical protein